MYDLAIHLDDRPGALAEMGEALGRAGVSIEGGGAWVVDGRGIAHFLFEDGHAARAALEAAGIRVLAVRDVVVQRLKQAVPGQLGQLTRRMAEAGVNIEVLYSDHDHQLVLVVDDAARARSVAAAWEREGSAPGGDEAAVRAVEAEYDAAWNAGDVGRIMACFGEDAVVVTPRGETLSGQAEIRQTLAALWDGAGGATLHQTTIARVAFVAPDVAVVDGHAVIDAPDAALPPHRFTDILVRRNGAWLITHVRAWAGPDRGL